MEDWAEIRRLHRAEGLPIKLIARTLKVYDAAIGVRRLRAAAQAARGALRGPSCALPSAGWSLLGIMGWCRLPVSCAVSVKAFPTAASARQTASGSGRGSVRWAASPVRASRRAGQGGPSRPRCRCVCCEGR